MPVYYLASGENLIKEKTLIGNRPPVVDEQVIEYVI